MKSPAVFLDRDNTIIHNDGDLGDPEQVELIQGVPPAIASLCGLGYKVVVVTNQGGVARGKYTEEDVDAVHDRIEQLVTERVNGARIDAFYFCPYHPQGKVARYKKEHPTRKPKPGMLKQAAEDLGLDLAQSWMVGDALRDIDAGAAAGCRTVLLQADWTNTSLADLRKQEASKSGGGGRGRKKHEPDFVAKGLVEAVRIIASQRKPEASEEISRTRIAGKRWDAEAMSKLQKQGRPAKATPEPAADPTPPDDKPEADAGAPDPPEVARGESPTDAKPTNGAANASRPFVPWTKQSPPPPPPPELPPAVSPESTSQSAPEATPEPESESPPQEPPAAEMSAAPDSDETPATTKEVAAEPAPGRVPPPESAADAEGLKKLNKTMRLVLQELRAQRGTSGEFHQLGVVAIVIQAVAFLCMLGALWMGGGDGGTGAFLRWIGVAIVLQLAVIATLLFSKPSA